VALAGVGIDAERAERFAKLARGVPHAWLRVFSLREVSHAARLARPELGLCVAFCCKEALLKAFGRPYPFPACQCFLVPGRAGIELSLAPGLLEERGLAAARVLSRDGAAGSPAECVVEVRVFRGAVVPVLSRIAAVEIATIEADRDAFAERELSPAEAAGLRGRRAQSLAGALALKRALAALWAASGRSAVAGSRDFTLARDPRGAPRLVDAPGGAAGACVSISHTREFAYGLAAVEAVGAAADADDAATRGATA
jgi:phosphopantetheinyl transferase (holo-ACP synthase)